MTQVVALIEHVQRQQALMQRPELTAAESMEALFAARYTGEVTFSFSEGVPTGFRVPNPVAVKVVRR